MEWITIEEVPTPRKTKVWLVREKKRGYQIGQIGWFTAWRKYAFYPFLNTVFEEQCLRNIADFCERQTREHKPTTLVARLRAKEQAMGK